MTRAEREPSPGTAFLLVSQSLQFLHEITSLATASKVSSGMEVETFNLRNANMPYISQTEIQGLFEAILEAGFRITRYNGYGDHVQLH
jgi:hypothetical protein